MAGPWTSERFPRFERAIERLTEQHRELEDEPLHLAMSYGSSRNEDEIFLFEVIGSRDESIGSDKVLFETTFEPNPSFATGFDQRLHLILTNPAEIEVALKDGWPSAKEIADAFQRKAYKVLFKDRVGEAILALFERPAKKPGKKPPARSNRG